MSKKIIVLFLVFIASRNLNAQSDAGALSLKIAARMRDSLSLTSQQFQAVFGVNRQVLELKQAEFSKQPAAEELRLALQRVENKRDSLYRPILGEEKFSQYLQKKQVLINNN